MDCFLTFEIQIIKNIFFLNFQEREVKIEEEVKMKMKPKKES